MSDIGNIETRLEELERQVQELSDLLQILQEEIQKLLNNTVRGKITQ